MVYIAFLRGVNVAKNVITMQRLGAIWAEMGHQHPRTYIQSGNVIFSSGEAAGKIVAAMEKRLAAEARLPIRVMLRSRAELGRIIGGSPFMKETGIDAGRLHVTLLDRAAGKNAGELLGKVEAGRDRYYVAGPQVYLYCPDGYGRTKLSNSAIEKRLSVTATTRNWNTMNRLYEMAAE
jgi:uncharacterized protein (DUF1697 family)